MAAPHTTTLGRAALGLGILALGLAALAIGDFLPGEAAPKALPERHLLAMAAGAVMALGGLAVIWRRTAAWGAGAIAAWFGLFVVLLMGGPLMARHWREYLAYESEGEQLALAMGGLVVLCATARLGGTLAGRVGRGAQIVFGLCAVIFGGAHFAYLNFTAPLVPKWLPFGGVFWAYATGAAQIAAGLAMVSGVQARLAAILLTVMYALFTPMVHLPQLLAKPTELGAWAEAAMNLALTGVAWVMADSFKRSGG